MTRTLVLLTTNHPFTHTGGETMFVAPEIDALARAFDRLHVVPLHDDGRRLPLPEGVVLDRSLAAAWRRGRALHQALAWQWPGFWRELWRGARHGGWVGAARVWRWAALARCTWAWMRERLPRDQPLLMYTYWRGGQTLAAARWAGGHAGSAAITRVHRYELYEEAFQPPFQPWTAIYASLALIVTVSRQGAEHLRARGVDPRRLRVARLGVAAAARRSAPSRDGVWRIVSCSNLVAAKRVELSARVLCALARRHPARRIEWTHFGDGPGRAALNRALRERPDNLAVTLAGRQPNSEVLRHYRDRPVDLLLQLSASEGLPVAVQEALAHGIPVLATDVGGVAEAVDRSGENGALVPADAPADAIVDALERLLLAPPEAVAALRDAAWRRWAQDFDAAANHGALAAELAHLDARWT